MNGTPAIHTAPGRAGRLSHHKSKRSGFKDQIQVYEPALRLPQPQSPIRSARERHPEDNRGLFRRR